MATQQKQLVDFQTLIERLAAFWKKQGCAILQPYDVEMGAGTFHPGTFLASLGPKPWRAAYVQPSRRPADGRYGENPLRTQHYYQYQVVLKPAPDNVVDLYLQSLKAVGVKLENHDQRFVQDDWESPTLGASGLGWEVWLDSLEITQFTYFQQMAGMELNPITAEITYGLERIAMFLQNRYDLFDLAWGKDLGWTRELSYGELARNRERESCQYNFEEADVQVYQRWFREAEQLGQSMAAKGLLSPAYECMLKMSHYFNILDARGAVSAMERAAYIGRVREMAKHCANLYLGIGEDPAEDPGDE
ncbi:MAG: glycine--tRNA ligase subunit alpha [Candidatus Omnitrophica bacterium]|nr:glycine--tRNA ligase subunit alpha [Candidatus Omnitrophota bacterium]